MSNNLKDLFIDNEDLIVLETAVNFLKICLSEYETYALSENTIVSLLQDAECHLYDNGISLSSKKIETICKKLNDDETWVNDL